MFDKVSDNSPEVQVDYQFEPKKPRKTALIFARLEKEDEEALDAVAENYGTTKSEVVRSFVREGLRRLGYGPQSERDR
jgi:hypothetical protein